MCINLPNILEIQQGVKYRSRACGHVDSKNLPDYARVSLWNSAQIISLQIRAYRLGFRLKKIKNAPNPLGFKRYLKNGLSRVIISQSNVQFSLKPKLRF